MLSQNMKIEFLKNSFKSLNSLAVFSCLNPIQEDCGIESQLLDSNYDFAL